MAVAARRPPPGLIHHADRGSQYASGDYRRQVLGNLLWRFWLESQGQTATDIHRLDLELQA